MRSPVPRAFRNISNSLSLQIKFTEALTCTCPSQLATTSETPELPPPVRKCTSDIVVLRWPLYDIRHSEKGSVLQFSIPLQTSNDQSLTVRSRDPDPKILADSLTPNVRTAEVWPIKVSVDRKGCFWDGLKSPYSTCKTPQLEIVK